MAKRSSKKAEFSAGLYLVHGRLFRTRDEAVAYCKAQRIPAFNIGLCPHPAGVELDPIKLSVREDWTLRVLFSDADPVLLFEHGGEAGKEVQSFKVRMSDLVDLTSSVRARVRELAKSGELL